MTEKLVKWKGKHVLTTDVKFMIEYYMLVYYHIPTSINVLLYVKINHRLPTPPSPSNFNLKLIIKDFSDLKFFIFTEY